MSTLRWTDAKRNNSDGLHYLNGCIMAIACRRPAMRAVLHLERSTVHTSTRIQYPAHPLRDRARVASRDKI
jgi:hypothetical protein